jgi:hypothetical protein
MRLLTDGRWSRKSWTRSFASTLALALLVSAVAWLESASADDAPPPRQHPRWSGSSNH